MHTRPIVPPSAMTPVEKNFQSVWDATSEVLVDYRFTVDQRNRRAGLITSHPLASRHFFELWRRDKVTASGALENTVQPIYRTVSVRILKEAGGSYHPVVTVTVSRLLSEPGQPEYVWTSYEHVMTASKKQEHLVIGVGSSDDSRKSAGKRSPGDDLLAKRIADDIRTLAHQKRSARTP